MQYGEERNSRHISRTHPPLSRIRGMDSSMRHAVIHLPTFCTSKVVGDLGAEDQLHLSPGSPKKQYGYAAEGSTPSYNSWLHGRTQHTIIKLITKQHYVTYWGSAPYDSHYPPISCRTNNHYNTAPKESLYKMGLPPSLDTSSPSKDLYAFLSAYLRFLWQCRGLSLQIKQAVRTLPRQH